MNWLVLFAEHKQMLPVLFSSCHRCWSRLFQTTVRQTTWHPEPIPSAPSPLLHQPRRDKVAMALNYPTLNELLLHVEICYATT